MASPKTKGRMIKREISNSKGFASLSPKAAVLFCMIIPHLDSHGKMNGGPGYLKDEVCPRVKYLTLKTIPALLKEVHDKTNVKWFEFDGRWWIHSTNFLQNHQELKPDRLGQDLLPTYSGVSTREVEVEVEVNNPLSELGSSDGPDDKVKLFNHWIRTCNMGPPPPAFTPERRKLLNARLKENKTLDDLAMAITGCSITPHNQGQNDRNTKYMNWELIFKNAGNVDRFIANYHNLKGR